MVNSASDTNPEQKVIDDVLVAISEDSSLSEEAKIKITQNFQDLKKQKLNILITGATGSGKSSTINAMFNADVAKVGIGVDPETMDIKKFELKKMTLWDSPGLGDGKEKDKEHAKNIIKKLYEKDTNGHALIDVVLVILDGASRDLGTSFELINQVIIPNIGEERKDRILVAINKCDMAMSGHHWNHVKNEPEPKLVEFLNEKVKSVHNRIFDDTGVNVTPIYYSAGYTDEETKPVPYNLAKLLYFIVKMTPDQKRLVYMNNVSKEPRVWEKNDDLENYGKETAQLIINSIIKTAGMGAAIGGHVGRMIAGGVGEVIGRVGGAVCGAVIGFFRGIFS